jgi:hypothetical protein
MPPGAAAAMRQTIAATAIFPAGGHVARTRDPRYEKTTWPVTGKSLRSDSPSTGGK